VSAVSRWSAELLPAISAVGGRTGPCHDAAHAVRVAVLAESIALAEHADPDAAVLAALTHDLGHGTASRHGTDDHETRSARIAVTLLDGRVPAGMVDDIRDAVAGRRFRQLGRSRRSTGAVLDDADNLDALGFSGVARVFLWVGEHGRPATGPSLDPTVLAAQDLVALESHWAAKLQLLPGLMHTPTGARLAAARATSMLSFLIGLRGELTELGLPEPAPSGPPGRTG
jgi:uncharacterized protein